MGGRLQKSFKKYLQDLSIAYRIPLSVAPVAQLDRVPGYEPGGRGFESYPAHQNFGALSYLKALFASICSACFLFLFHQ